jgi:gliding motility-associated-like protein
MQKANTKTMLEQKIKQAIENYQAEYNPADWKDLENRLNKIQKRKEYGKLAIAASVIVVAGLIYYFYKPSEQNSHQNYENGKTQTIITREKNEISVQQNHSADKQPVINHQPSEKTDKSFQVEHIQNTTREQKEMTHPSGQKIYTSDKSTENKTIVPENPPPDNTTQKSNENTTTAEVTIRCDKNTVCVGEEIRFYAENTLAADNHRWEFGDGKFSSEKEPTHIYKKAGAYKVKLRIISSTDKKTKEYLLNEIVTVHPLPEAEIKWFSAEENKLTINFEARGKNLVEWKWDLGDRENSTQQEPVHTYSKKGDYTVALTVKNSFGCSATYKQNVKVETEDNLLAPTGFSPNGDGINDTWIPVALLEGNKNFVLTIFSPSGQVVYQTSDKNRPWDGANTKPGETYLWKVLLKENNGKELNYKGAVTVTE